ncbi:MAG: hypothetical protein ABFE16_01925 [Armatimonadia bacterium]
MSRSRFVLAALLLLAGVGQAQKELSTEVVLQAEEATVAPGKPLSFKFTVPPNPLRFAGVISLEARIDSPKLAGGTSLLWPILNGVKLEVERHVYRGRQFSFADGRLLSTYSGGGYFLYYAPDYTIANTADSNYKSVDGHASDLKFVVTDLLREGENELVLENTSTVDTRVVKVRSVKFAWENVRPFEAPALQAGPPEGPLPFYEPAPTPNTVPLVQMDRDGKSGLSIAADGRRWLVNSRFSIPGGQWDGFVSEQVASDTALGWGMMAMVTATNSQRRVVRQVLTLPRCVQVRDTLMNLTDADLPVRIHHELSLSEAPEAVYLNGLKRPLKQGSDQEPANPTTFVKAGDAGIGLMPVDDVTRVHSRNYFAGTTGGFADDYFVLKPHESRMTQWWIFPVHSGDYYDFVNAVRWSQSTNFRLDGSFAFVTAREPFTKWTDEQAANWVDKLSLRYASCSISAPLYQGKYPHGTAFPLVDHKPQRDLLAHLKRVRPQLKTLVYYHVFISTEEGASQKYKSDRLLKASGEQADYRNPIYPLFFPTLENAYGRAMERNVDLILGTGPDDLGADGVYWDELSWSSETWHFGEPWDGCSGFIDAKTNELTRKVSHVTLITNPFRVKMIQKIMGAGHPLIGNGNPVTETETGLHFPRFVETGSITNLVKSHLYTPIGLGDHLTERTEQDVMDNIRRFLDYGCLYYYYHQQATENVTQPGLSRYMWPITPIELHEGFIIGQERILTNRSGNFGWADGSRHEVHVFDRTGKELPWKAPTVTQDGHTYTELRIPGGYVAAILRR